MFKKQCCIYTYIYIYVFLYLPGSARQAPGRKFWKKKKVKQPKKMAYTIQPKESFLRCRSNELLKLRDAPTNEQMAVEMPTTWHERIHAQLTEWINETVNQWIRESLIQWSNESNDSNSMNQRIKEAMNPWINESVTRRANKPLN